VVKVAKIVLNDEFRESIGNEEPIPGGNIEKSKIQRKFVSLKLHETISMSVDRSTFNMLRNSVELMVSQMFC
jgi:hypothetical protein